MSLRNAKVDSSSPSIGTDVRVLTRPAKAGSRRALVTLAVVCLVLVTHGSLYPWRFEVPPDLQASLMRLLTQGAAWSGLGDVVGNVALFVPVGVLGMLVHGARSTRAPLRWLLLLVLGSVFALALQVLQIYVPARSPALSDVLWNALGLCIGMAMAHVARRIGRTPVHGSGMPLAIVALWLALEWWPLVPTIDLQHVKDALKPLLLTPRWSLASTLEAALGVAVAAHLLRGMRQRVLLLLGLLVLAAAGKLFISGQSLSLSLAVGFAAGLMLAAITLRVHAESAAMLLIGAALAWFSADALRPYEVAEHSTRFEWIPFVALLQGSLGANTLALGVNVYWLGVVMVLAAQIEARLGMLAVGIALWVLALEAAQAWLPGRIADVTPALIPLFWLALLRAASPLGTPRAVPVSAARRVHA